MKMTKGLAWLGLTVMSASIVYGFLYGEFMTEGGIILGSILGQVTLIDLYISLMIVVGWIWFREREWTWRIVWLIFVMVFGSFASCLYVLIALYRCNDDPKVFFMGKYAR